MNDQPVNAMLVAGLEDYLIRRRALGFGLIEEERHARRFLEWLWTHGNTGASFTSAQALSWARGEGQFKNSYQGQRLAAVRGMARYCHAIGLDVGVPAANALRAGRDRQRPHIYTQDELDALITACRRVFTHALVQATMANIIALLAVTGMRVGEVLRLSTSDINQGEGTVLVRAIKNGPDRLVPIHPTTVEALAGYEMSSERLAAGPQSDGPPLFVTVRGGAYRRPTLESHFQRIRHEAGLSSHFPAPRLYDLRHTFATRQMIRAYNTEGADPAATLSLLAIWLGHSDPSHTYWYIHAVPELLALAAARMNPTITME